jgi:hypothetical protein
LGGNAKRWKSIDSDESASTTLRGWDVADEDFIPESASMVDSAPGLQNGVGNAGGDGGGGIDLALTEKEMYEAQEGSQGVDCACCKARFASRIPVKDEHRAREYRLFMDLMLMGYTIEYVAAQVATHHNKHVREYNMRNGLDSSEWTAAGVLRHLTHHIVDERVTHICNLRTLRTHKRHISDSIMTRDGVTGRLRVNNHNFRSLILAMKQEGQEHDRLTRYLENQRGGR